MNWGPQAIWDWLPWVLLAISMLVDWRRRIILEVTSYDKGYSHGLIDGELRGKLHVAGVYR